jgi:BA14K-like protein
MSGCSKLIASACLAASASWFAGSAAAAPAHPAALQNNVAQAVLVQVRDGGRAGRGAHMSRGRAGAHIGSNWSGRRGNWSGQHAWVGRRRWGGGPRISFGLGFGAPYAYGYPYDDWYGSYGYDNSYVVVAPDRDDDAVAYCSRRFRSYDPDTGTYLGYDGLRHPCP